MSRLELAHDFHKILLVIIWTACICARGKRISQKFDRGVLNQKETLSISYIRAA